MESLDEWAVRWKIPAQAMTELGRCMTHSIAHAGGGLESVVQASVRLDAAKQRVLLFRNNCGAGKLESGNFVRFGLANDSPKVNAVCKSGDLIGVRPLAIQPHHVGSIVGQFVSRECKRVGWHYTGTQEEQAQAKWAAIINQHGGDACFVTGPGSFIDSADNRR